MKIDIENVDQELFAHYEATWERFLADYLAEDADAMPDQKRLEPLDLLEPSLNR